MQAIFFKKETYAAILLILNDDKNTTQSRWIKIYSSKILFTSFHLNNQTESGFPASRGLSRRGKNERKSLSFLSFLPRRERPLLAGKVRAAYSLFLLLLFDFNIFEVGEDGNA